MTKRSFKVSIIAMTLAIIIAAGSMLLMSGAKASANSYAGSAQANSSIKTVQTYDATVADRTARRNVLAKTFVFKTTGKAPYGYDWTYKTDNTNLKIKCVYNFGTKTYTFRITGTAQGGNHLTLKYKDMNGKWAAAKMTFTVDAAKNIMRTA